MKNKILCCIVSVMLFFPTVSISAAEPFDIAENANTQVQSGESVDIENNSAALSQLDEDIDLSEPEKTELPYKQPLSKKILLKKFIIAMFVVAFSLVFLYIVLTLYNRFMGYSVKNIAKDESSLDLKAADNVSDAVKSFLNKTNWE